MLKFASLVGVVLVTALLTACSGAGMTRSAYAYDTSVDDARDDDKAVIVLAASTLDLDANMEPSGSSFCGGSGGGDRTAWVLSDKPLRLSLLGNSRRGNELSCSQGDWVETGRGWMTQITFSSSYATEFHTLRLVREDGKGWSDWNKDGYNEMSYLRHSNIGKGDPACVGGRAWCAVRGL